MNVLIILYPGCIYYEVATAVTLLSDFSCSLQFCSDQSLVKTGEGLTFQCDLSLKKASENLYDLILIPGGDCESIMGNQDLIALLQQANARQTLIAAICNGALVMAQSGILDKKRCTHTACLKYADPEDFSELLAVATPLFENSHYIDEDVVIDGRIITAKPWAHIEFAVKTAQCSGLIEEEKILSTINYYRGLK